MIHYNLIAIINPTGTHALFCLRRKEPYRGLYNFVGGKINPGEDSIDAAYRELHEETGIRREHISLLKLMVLEYPLENMRMEVYAGQLRRSMEVYGSENDLVWLPVKQNYADTSRFSGVGNLGHIMSYIRKMTTLLD